MIRSALSLLLCALLVLTSHSAGAARGSDRAVDHMVICIGDQTAVIYVGADGAPVSVPHYCPDCALHGLDMLALAAARLGPAPGSGRLAVVLADAIRSARQTHCAYARAPPALI